MKTYQIEFTGRPLGTIGVWSEQFQLVYADDEKGALRALSEHYERNGKSCEIREAQNPFTADGLLLEMQNERETHERIGSLVESIVNTARRCRDKLARKNADWYDDKEGELYCVHHDKPERQYPEELILEAVAETVLYHLRERCGGVRLGISDRLSLAKPGFEQALRACITDEDGMKEGLGRQRRRLLTINDIARVALGGDQ